MAVISLLLTVSSQIKNPWVFEHERTHNYCQSNHWVTVSALRAGVTKHKAHNGSGTGNIAELSQVKSS
jgi:hypothetical protein